MRRVGLLVTAVVMLAVTSVAMAALPYKTGTYKAGAQSGTDNPGVRITVKSGSFSVKRISYPEKCTGADPEIDDEFNFIAGQNASLTGKISKKGHLSGRYDASDGTVKVSGTVKGKKATITSSETNTFTPQGSTGTYTCRGSATFHAVR
jgi:uncharacterized protein with FMN-binding domain